MKRQRPGVRPSGDSVNLQLPLLLFTFCARTIFTTPPKLFLTHSLCLYSLAFLICYFFIFSPSLYLSFIVFVHSFSFFHFSFFSLCHSLISSLSLSLRHQDSRALASVFLCLWENRSSCFLRCFSHSSPCLQITRAQRVGRTRSTNTAA